MDELKLEFDKLPGENIAVTEEFLVQLIKKIGLNLTVNNMIAQKLIRKIKTSNDQTFYLILNHSFSNTTTGPSVKRKANNDLEKENNSNNNKCFIDGEIDELRKDNTSLLNELAIDRFEDATSIYNEYINLLHDYNDLKDVVQALIGKLAFLRDQTTKELYPEFGLDTKD